jgi:hypothetical protein
MIYPIYYVNDFVVNKTFLNLKIVYIYIYYVHVRWVPVTTAWRVLGLRMEEQPPAMEGSCEYIE